MNATFIQSKPEVSRNHQSSSCSVSAPRLPYQEFLGASQCLSNSAFHRHRSVVAAFLVMAMATGTTMASYTAVRSPSQLQNSKATGSAIACPALSSRASIAFSGTHFAHTITDISSFCVEVLATGFKSWEIASGKNDPILGRCSWVVHWQVPMRPFWKWEELLLRRMSEGFPWMPLWRSISQRLVCVFIEFAWSCALVGG